MSTIKAKFISAPINGATVEPLVLQTNNIDRVTIDSNGVLNISNQVYKDSSGNVGIGTSTPVGKLDVSGTIKSGSGIGFVTMEGGNSTNTGYNGFYNAAGVRQGYLGFGDTTSGISLATDPGSNMPVRFVVNGIERARFTTSGNFLVGATSTAVGIGDLTTVAGSQLAADGFVGATRPNEAAAYFTRTGSNGRVMHCYRDAANVGGISVTTTGTAFNTTSDYRLKDNVQPMQNALAKVSELKPVTYKWKVDGSDGQGFIAHELQAVFPDAVDGEKDAVNADGKPVYQGIDTSFLVATLTAAIQEQQQMIETLQAKVAALEASA